MYDDHPEIINTGTLHFDITPEKLAQPHQSQPWNPIIANVFYRAGTIEQWGTGTLKVIDWCGDNANPAPNWPEQSGSVVVAFRPAPGFAAETTPQVTEEVEGLLSLARTPRSRQELLRDLGLSDREHFRKAYLLPALESGMLERTIPDKPQSSKQRYRLTEKGEAWLRQQRRQ
jgi:ATP-dependent DNA helicase RecG